MKLSVVILTMGDRPAELDRAVASTAALRAAGAELVVVGNGADVPLVSAESPQVRAESPPVQADVPLVSTESLVQADVSLVQADVPLVSAESLVQADVPLVPAEAPLVRAESAGMSGVTIIRLAQNAGVAGGRNAGVRACAGDVVMFLDDDGWYPDPADLGEHVASRFAADPALAVLSFRVLDPDGGPGGRWHVPRLRSGDPGRSSPVTTFAGGACAIRRSAYLEAGGLPDAFFFAHEETDLSWRLINLGYRLEYDAAATMCHPAVPNARHATWYRLDGRNRVLLARRNLPWPLAFGYLADWLVITMVRERSPSALRAWLSGFAAGWRMDPGPRQPISLRTVWRMTRAGRPPII